MPSAVSVVSSERGDLVEAFELDRHKLQAKVHRYRALLEQHGIQVPDDDGAMEFYRANREMVRAAADFLEAAAALRAQYGTSIELLSDKRWRG